MLPWLFLTEFVCFLTENGRFFTDLGLESLADQTLDDFLRKSHAFLLKTYVFLRTADRGHESALKDTVFVGKIWERPEGSGDASNLGRKRNKKMLYFDV